MIETTTDVTISMFVLEVPAAEARARDIDGLVSHLRASIEAHPCARFLGVFDHYAHTRMLPDGEIAPDIEDAKNVVFGFGMSIPEPCALAMRPRSIGICKLPDRFVISFLEPPMPLANAAMEVWVRSLLLLPPSIRKTATEAFSEERRGTTADLPSA